MFFKVSLFCAPYLYKLENLYIILIQLYHQDISPSLRTTNRLSVKLESNGSASDSLQDRAVTPISHHHSPWKCLEAARYFCSQLQSCCELKIGRMMIPQRPPDGLFHFPICQASKIRPCFAGSQQNLTEHEEQEPAIGMQRGCTHDKPEGYFSLFALNQVCPWRYWWITRGSESLLKDSRSGTPQIQDLSRTLAQSTFPLAHKFQECCNLSLSLIIKGRFTVIII